MTIRRKGGNSRNLEFGTGLINGAPLLLRFNNVQQGFYIVQTKLSTKFQGFCENFICISKIQIPIRPKNTKNTKK